jgi:hypothetical protein
MTIDEFIVDVDREMSLALDSLSAITALFVFVDRLHGGDGFWIMQTLWGPL